MVYDKTDLGHRPQLSFTHSELALVYQAAKGSRGQAHGASAPEEVNDQGPAATNIAITKWRP